MSTLFKALDTFGKIIFKDQYSHYIGVSQITLEPTCVLSDAKIKNTSGVLKSEITFLKNYVTSEGAVSHIVLH